jgi:hypothetical protein
LRHHLPRDPILGGALCLAHVPTAASGGYDAREEQAVGLAQLVDTGPAEPLILQFPSTASSGLSFTSVMAGFA